MKNTNTKFEQTKATPRKTLDFQQTKSKDTSSTNPPLQLEEEVYTTAATNLIQFLK